MYYSNLDTVMTAKRDIIKELRQEVKDLQVRVDDQNRELNHIKSLHQRELEYINRVTNMLSDSLHKHFAKELAWQELCNDPESKMRLIKHTSQRLKHLCQASRSKT